MRTIVRCSAVVTTVFSLLLGTQRARADLLPPFDTKLQLDTAYVTGASQATDIAFSADGRAVVTRKTGEIMVRRANGTVNVVSYPFPATLDTASEKGLLGVVADPNVASNNTFYFYVSNGPTDDKHRIYRAVLTASDTFTVDTNPVVGAARGVGPGLEGPANHDGGGMIIFGNQLYVGVGDTGSNATPPTNKYGSCLNKGNGKILRVNLDGSVPSDNPLVGMASVTACTSTGSAWSTAAPDTRIFAWGLRNPWRLWVDPITSLLWIGDVGEATSEEVSVGGGNQHYGYPFVEGSQVWGDVSGMNCTSMSPSRTCTPPVYAYSHAEGQAITGGLIPSGCGWSNVFTGANYVFGDSSASFIRALPVNGAHTGVSSTTPVTIGTFSGQTPVSFRMGPDQSLYVVMNAGSVYRFTPRNRSGASCVPPVPAQSRYGALWLFVALGVIGVGVTVSRAQRPESKLS